MRRPRLKRWRIATNSREIRIMQPIQNLLLLAHACIPQSILTILPRPMPQRDFRILLWARTIIRLLPAATDKQHIAGLDVTALRSGSDVYALVDATLVQVLPGNRIVVVRVVVDAFFVRVAPVVEQDAAAGDAVLGPVVDGAFVICTWASNVATLCLRRVNICLNAVLRNMNLRRCRKSPLGSGRSGGIRPIAFRFGYSWCTSHHRRGHQQVP